MQTPYQLSLNEVQNTQENITTSESQSQQKQASETVGRKRTNSSRIGDVYELAVAYEAMLRGAEVFRNLSCVGNTDLVLEKDAKFFVLMLKP